MMRLVMTNERKIMQVSPSRFVRAREIAELLAVSERAVYALRRKGVLPGYVIAGSVRFLIEEVLEVVRGAK